MPTKKLIEVALPLDDINAASTREKSIRDGHPSALHLWWARRPLAACRAVLFASLIDDPDQEGVPAELLAEIDRLDPPELPDWRKLPLAEQRRQRLFRFIKTLVQWESSNDQQVLNTARRLIHTATRGNPPPVYDPFAGGGSIPLEAQRLGLEAHASDLNPVAVLINKALIEIPPKFANMPPVNPIDRNQIGAEWQGAAGLAADVRYYGKWMRDEAEWRIGHLYPKVKLSKEHGGGEATVIAWLWTYTVECPNPACGAHMPLVRSFWLSKRPRQKAWIEPVTDRSKHPPTVEFIVRTGEEKPHPETINRRGAICICCGSSTSLDYVRSEGKKKRLNVRLMAIVAEGPAGRIFVSPSLDHEHLADNLIAGWKPDVEMAVNPRHMTPPLYGMSLFSDIFTSRQLIALDYFSTLVEETKQYIRQDLVSSAHSGSVDSYFTQSYAEVISTYLALSVSKAADLASKISQWQPHQDHLKIAPTFSRHALPISWDYAEGNPFSNSSGNFYRQVELIVRALERLLPVKAGKSYQGDAREMVNVEADKIISTDPPYYNNVPYADISDFFYIWLRRSLIKIYPELFTTLLVPKSEELVADPLRQGGNEQAQKFFEEGLARSFRRMCMVQNSEYPLTVYYAFKQAEGSDSNDINLSDDVVASSTGWETMLTGLVSAGFVVVGTWPVRTERPGRFRETGSNALATSIVLVCRPRTEDARTTTRLEFIRMLRRELPAALRALQHANIAPVDLAQAAIGPGMAIYSRYKAVLEADGTPMRVRTALQLINQALDEVLAEQEGEYDADTRWAIAWFEQHAFDEGAYGVAETLSKAKNTSVQGMVDAGVVAARAGKVRLLRRGELPERWDAASDSRLTIWEVTQHLVWALDQGGEQAAAVLLAGASQHGDAARDLAYRLYTTCERKKWAAEALAYNSLVVAWPEIARLAAERASKTEGPVQGRMFE